MVVVSEMNSQFWGLTLDGLKRYTQTVEKSFHISMAALEPIHVKGGSDMKDEPVSVMIQHKNSSFVLCSLQQGLVFQVPLDLHFAGGEELTLFLKGKGVVHLTGYLLEEDLPPCDEFGDSDSEFETTFDTTDADTSTDVRDIGRKRKKTLSEKISKRAKLDDSDEDEEDSDDDDFIDDEAEEASEDSEEEDMEEQESDDSDADSDADGKKTATSPKESKQPVVEMSKKQMKKAVRLAKREAKLKSENEKSQMSATTQSPGKTAAKSDANHKPVAAVDENEPKKKKNKKKKKKSKQEGMEETTVKKPAEEVASKPAKKRVLEGGLVVEDLKEGHGPEAKIGKMVHVYYAGRLQNGKLFDSKTSGSGFKFRLGKKEVISGWDLGLAGMKVGGKRKIIIPPKLGYGSQKTEGIPPNSVLVFEVELKAVS